MDNAARPQPLCENGCCVTRLCRADFKLLLSSSFARTEPCRLLHISLHSSLFLICLSVLAGVGVSSPSSSSSFFAPEMSACFRRTERRHSLKLCARPPALPHNLPVTEGVGKTDFNVNVSAVMELMHRWLQAHANIRLQFSLKHTITALWGIERSENLGCAFSALYSHLFFFLKPSRAAVC